MHARGGTQWKSRPSRRKTSLGPLRRAHPASGATWNVQVVRGKMTSRCLWHACRALALGMLLMGLGGGMATIGYFANQLSIFKETRGNATISVKNESRGFHLNNLSYVGPIVMGFGVYVETGIAYACGETKLWLQHINFAGFIVVAACVMTFEARDSAAKVVPARFKLGNSVRTNSAGNRTGAAGGGSTSRRATAGAGTAQANRWEHHLGVFRTSPCTAPVVGADAIVSAGAVGVNGGIVHDRQALTAALVHFSRALGSPKGRRFSRSGSVPNLASGYKSSQVPHHHHHHSPILKHHTSGANHPHHHHRSSRTSSSMCQRATREIIGTHLHPGMLQFHRLALSVDESGPVHQHKTTGGGESHGSQHSVHFNLSEDHQRVRERPKRSDTARRHVLSRQRPIEREEPHSPRMGLTSYGRRRSSITSDASGSRRQRRAGTSISRTPSMDSKKIQADLHSPEKFSISPRSPRRGISAQYSTPSVEKEFRSQLSISSEPTTTIRALSCQSSLEPCVPEESHDSDDKEQLPESAAASDTGIEVESPIKSLPPFNSTDTKHQRPDTLFLDCNSTIKTDASNSGAEPPKVQPKKKFLYRSNSSRLYRPAKPKTQLEQIYFISNNKEDEYYDSIEVIDERRNKNFKRSQTVVYDIYTTPEQKADACQAINEGNEPQEDEKPEKLKRSTSEKNLTSLSRQASVAIDSNDTNRTPDNIIVHQFDGDVHCHAA